ncbi:hypothetical protein N7448_000822 [Penicillium atrosanguineum]|uniref:Uncharacterized protein n=1 Tax=Penicillium atrosanguineum TaxID=1132637 RepID=A0A9W9Q3N5_9EURO|nr:Nucleic acid-binding OB-fold [Penicillium atrosanguineum]KAJ5149244.1 hypothetical protein N7448_000822 [Penicillium atrosanguineum]KAJ5304557.1 Nucleic acid-binding OB-fold [Penicillium atrosanguineum]KAJ5324026.1 hypothetical protein N7476_002626 [Penicillium atrosanguineum]
MADLLYPQGSLRYFFFHGNHGDVPIPETVTVEAKIVAFTGQGQILFGENFENNPSVYHFTNGVYKGDGQNERPLPASHFTERLLKNVSVPTLVLAETPNHCMGNDFETPDPFIYM